MSSRRTISDDIHCMNILHSTVDVSRKNVFIWLSIIYFCWPITAVGTNDTHLLAFLGLPRKNHCAINYNNALFILKGQNTDPSLSSLSSPMSLSITFTNSMLDSSSMQMPSIQWMQNDNSNQSSFASICTVTSYGQAIIFYSNLQTNDTIDLNWTSAIASQQRKRRRQKHSTSIPPSDLITVAATIMDDDKVLIIGRNSTTLSTWLLDASDNQLEWTWSQLSSTRNAAHEPRWTMMMDGVSDGFVSASLTTMSSYILYFGVDQQSSSEMYYNVSVYCFDISSLTWTGSLLNFTSPTNHIQPVMINKQISNNNSDTNDTLLIVPDWIDVAINATTTSDRNVTNTDAVHQQTQQQYQDGQQNGYWIMNIQSLSSSSSSLPSAHLLWHSSNEFISVNGGSATLINDTVVFYGGEYDIRGTESLTSIHNNIDYAAGLNSEDLRFWNSDSQMFLPTPAWLAPFLPSPSSIPFPPTETTSPLNYDDGYHTVIIILSTFLGLFAIGFIILLVLLLWRRNNRQVPNATPTHDNDQLLETSIQRRTPMGRIDQPDSAATWAEQLHRSFSIMLHRLGPSPSQQRKANTTSSGLIISSPLESFNRDMEQVERGYHQENRATDSRDINETIRDPDLQQQQQQRQQEQEQEQEHPPPILPLSTSSPSIVSDSVPQSTRNSWREEGSTKASRFVEHF